MNRTRLDAVIVAALLLTSIPDLAGELHALPSQDPLAVLTQPAPEPSTPDNPAERLC